MKLLKLHQFYSAKNTRRDTQRSLKLFFFNWKPIFLNRKQFFREKPENSRKKSIFWKKFNPDVMEDPAQLEDSTTAYNHITNGGSGDRTNNAQVGRIIKPPTLGGCK